VTPITVADILEKAAGLWKLVSPVFVVVVMHVPVAEDDQGG
jgi:hypothetical protein